MTTACNCINPITGGSDQSRDRHKLGSLVRDYIGLYPWAAHTNKELDIGRDQAVLLTVTYVVVA